MKHTSDYTYHEIKIGDEKTRMEDRKYIDSYVAKQHEKQEKIDAVLHCIKFIFFTPFVIAAGIVSFVLKLVGQITSIGLPYGIYCAYQTVVQLKAGVALGDIKQTTFVCLFLLLPFIAFAMSALVEKIGNTLEFSI